ncbi:hypothetical protein GQ43DRAFT_440856 [Delitschia confertaspora ATCC 74209]|uniref:Alpha/beta hydrolase fold-3 domain-containing protein n=1 Tax=Delitschia confertaspora ATCC 74209 TaxID=1513339 RepID=A0A9P4JKJ7_9PLEO|nr:hypothetical protein GQ43DRAFT_440856 [Delitschia confertaspora ATCC 74209]
MSTLTREETIRSGEAALEYREAFTARPIEITGEDIFAIRASRAAHLQALRYLYPLPGPIPHEVTETEHHITMRDGLTITLRVYLPKEDGSTINRDRLDDGKALVMMYHEGGWCMGDLTDEDLNCRMFCQQLGVVCVNVEYRLAPEHPFPTGVHDCYDALLWAISAAPSLGANPSRGLIVGGASAGGNLAAVLACLARDEELNPPITGQYLCVPALLPKDNVPERFREEYESREANRSDPVLKELNEDLISVILAPDPKSPLWDPFNHALRQTDNSTKLPRAYFQVCGMDPLRDEGILYERVLRESGVETRLDLYEGYGHMFWTNYPELERSRKFGLDTVEGVRWLLRKE